MRLFLHERHGVNSRKQTTVLEGIEIRKATLDDREALFQIHMNSVRTLCVSHYSKNQIERWFEGRSSADYTGAIEYGGEWIASVQDGPVAFVEFFARSISMLYVHSAASGRGIGRLLMEHALATMPGDQGRISLEALLNAVLFYEKFGFEKVGDGQLRRASGLIVETVLMERRDHR